MERDNPGSLFKFVPFQEAESILSDGHMEWIAPHLLHDPFENSLKTTLGFNRAQLEAEMIQRITTMIFAFDDPSGEGKGTPIQKAIRRWRNEDRFQTEEEVEAAMSEVVTGLVEQHYEKNDLGRTLKNI